MTGEYDLETFKKAVIAGQHPDGDSLDINMPRWIMSDADLADLFAFSQIALLRVRKFVPCTLLSRFRDPAAHQYHFRAVETGICR